MFVCGQDQAGGGNATFGIGHNTSGRLSGFMTDGTTTYTTPTTSAATAVAQNVWTHVALVRSGTTLNFFINGALVSSVTCAGTIPDRAARFAVGGLGNYETGGTGGVNGERWLGYLDEFRLTKGVARYSGAFTPSQIAAFAPPTDGLTISWDRRTRFAKNFTNGYVPLGETSESYQVDIFLDATYTTLKRTLSVSTPTATYTNAQQVTDFGVLQTNLYVDVYQISPVVGRGYKLRGAV
jgi:hypothetical protein